MGTEFYKCSDVASPGSEPSDPRSVLAEDIIVSVLRAETKMSRFCDECLSGWIALKGL